MIAMRPIALLILLLTGACGAPVTVEGVFASEPFSLRSERPIGTEAASGRDIVVVMTERAGETLKTVTVELRGIEHLPLGKPVAVGSGARDDVRPTLDVAVGPLVVDTRPDGVEVWTAADPNRGLATGGFIQLDARDGDSVSGTFEVELDDGGHLTGSFVAAMVR
jgi:hypothetical protein